MSEGRQNPIDDEWESGTDACHQRIKMWRRLYMKKNQKRKIEIVCRCWHTPEQTVFWQYWIQLHKDEKVIEKHRITEQAYDILTADESLPRNQYTGVEFVTLQTFKP